MRSENHSTTFPDLECGEGMAISSLCPSRISVITQAAVASCPAEVDSPIHSLDHFASLRLLSFRIASKYPSGFGLASLAGIPAMPVISPSEQVLGGAYPLLDGLSPTIGWEFRTQAKGGPVFVMLRRSGLGSLKVTGSFPLTEDGWARAWQSLVTQNPAAAPQVLAALQVREADAARLDHQRWSPASCSSSTPAPSPACAVWSISAGMSLSRRSRRANGVT